MREALIVICWISISLIGQCFDINVRFDNVGGEAIVENVVLVNDENNSYDSIMNWHSSVNIDLKLTLRNLTGARTPSNMLDALSFDVWSLDYKTNQLQFFGPFNPVFLICYREIIQHKIDKFPLSSFLGEELQTIKNNEIRLENGGTLYIFSDGYPNQFSEPKRKKIKYKQFRDLLLVIQDKDMVDQKIILDKTIENWRGELEQHNDILVIGVKINE